MSYKTIQTLLENCPKDKVDSAILKCVKELPDVYYKIMLTVGIFAPDDEVIKAIRKALDEIEKRPSS